jgi:hypothetical protein
MAHAGSRGKRREGWRRRRSPAGLEQRVLGAAVRRSRWVDAVQGEQQHRRRRSGRRLGEDAPAWRRRPPPRALLLLLLLSLTLRCGGGERERGLGWLGFRSAAGLLCAAPGLLGVRAGTRGGITARASGGEKEVRAGGYALLSRSGATRGLAGDASERGRGGGGKREKGGERLGAPVAERR